MQSENPLDYVAFILVRWFYAMHGKKISKLENEPSKKKKNNNKMWSQFWPFVCRENVLLVNVKIKSQALFKIFSWNFFFFQKKGYIFYSMRNVNSKILPYSFSIVSMYMYNFFHIVWLFYFSFFSFIVFCSCSLILY